MTDEQWWPLEWKPRPVGDPVGISKVLLPNGIKLNIYDNRGWSNWQAHLPDFNVIAHPDKHSFHCGSFLELRCMLIMLATLYPEE